MMSSRISPSPGGRQQPSRVYTCRHVHDRSARRKTRHIPLDLLVLRLPGTALGLPQDGRGLPPVHGGRRKEAGVHPGASGPWRSRSQDQGLSLEAPERHGLHPSRAHPCHQRTDRGAPRPAAGHSLTRRVRGFPQGRPIPDRKSARLLREAGITEEKYRQVHRSFEKASPESHRRFLRHLGFSAQQIADLLKEVRKSI